MRIQAATQIGVPCPLHQDEMRIATLLTSEAGGGGGCGSCVRTAVSPAGGRPHRCTRPSPWGSAATPIVEPAAVREPRPGWRDAGAPRRGRPSGGQGARDAVSRDQQRIRAAIDRLTEEPGLQAVRSWPVSRTPTGDGPPTSTVERAHHSGPSGPCLHAMGMAASVGCRGTRRRRINPVRRSDRHGPRQWTEHRQRRGTCDGQRRCDVSPLPPPGPSIVASMGHRNSDRRHGRCP